MFEIEYRDDVAEVFVKNKLLTLPSLYIYTIIHVLSMSDKPLALIHLTVKSIATTPAKVYT